MTIKIGEYLNVQAVRKDGKNVRVRIPVKVAEANDIRSGDLVRITIEEHIKVGRE